MNQKGFSQTIIIFVVVGLIIIGAVGYFIFNIRTPVVNQTPTNNLTPTATPQTSPEQQPKPTPTNTQPPIKTFPSQQEINPDNYKSIILEKNKPNYVKSKGAIKILFSQSSTISFSIEKVNSPNTEFNNNPLPFVVYTNESTIPKDPNNNYVYGKYGDYSYTFTAPEIPGKYDVVFSEPELNSQKITDVASKYEITVVGKVDNELLVSKIVDRAIFAKLDEANLRGWKIASQEIKSVGNNWDVVMQINYNSCGIDWESNVCTAKVVKEHYLINKSSGLATESNL